MGSNFGTLLTNLPKTFNCIDHSLLVAKFYGYVISSFSFKLILYYFVNRIQHTSIIQKY